MKKFLRILPSIGNEHVTHKGNLEGIAYKIKIKNNNYWLGTHVKEKRLTVSNKMQIN